LFRKVVQEYMHGPYEEGANSTSELIIHTLKFSGTSYVIASLATAYLFPIKLILAEVRCLMDCEVGVHVAEKPAFPVYHC